MFADTMKKASLAGLLLTAAAGPAHAHVGTGTASSLSAGFLHPLFAIDHMAVMIAVGLWAALRGGKALWAWPVAFVGIMVIGGTLGMAAVPLPFVEPVILVSVVTLGLLVALAVDLPVAAGVAVIGLFALFHGHAHGTEVPENAGGLEYMAGFALATAALHATGLLGGLALGVKFDRVIRFAGAACAAIGSGLVLGAI